MVIDIINKIKNRILLRLSYSYRLNKIKYSKLNKEYILNNCKLLLKDTHLTKLLLTNQNVDNDLIIKILNKLNPSTNECKLFLKSAIRYLTIDFKTIDYILDFCYKNYGKNLNKNITFLILNLLNSYQILNEDIIEKIINNISDYELKLRILNNILSIQNVSEQFLVNILDVKDIGSFSKFGLGLTISRYQKISTDFYTKYRSILYLEDHSILYENVKIKTRDEIVRILTDVGFECYDDYFIGYGVLREDLSLPFCVFPNFEELISSTYELHINFKVVIYKLNYTSIKCILSLDNSVEIKKLKGDDDNKIIELITIGQFGKKYVF